MAQVSRVVIGLLLALAVAACGDDGDAGAGGTGGGGGGGGSSTASSTGAGGDVEELRPDAEPLPGHDACIVTVTTGIPLAAAKHVELCSDVSYATNPPSGGDHWPRWAAFGTYEEPVAHELLVHDLEHGAIALLHDCDGCEDVVVDAFTEATQAYGADPKCLQSGSVARFVIAPDPSLDHPVALAAWGATYVATCIDPPSLAAFIEDHYAKAPEDTCAAGVVPDEVGCE